jgi:hypothetical protein
MTEKETENKKRGICGKCPIGIGMPLCAICALAGIAIVYNIVR